jgi:hypothetical protein
LLTLYESRLSRRFLQTLKQLREIQAERRALEQKQLEEMYEIAQQHPGHAGMLEPSQFGFVCSNRDWHLYFKRRRLLSYELKHGKNPATPAQIRDLLTAAA